MAIVRNVLAGALAVGAVIIFGIVGIIGWGVYDVAATRQHTCFVYDTLRIALRRSIAHHSKEIQAPRFDAAAAQRGLLEYRDHCRRCHGAPGVAPDEFALGMAPLPINLVHAARTSTPEQIYWTIRNGIKMTGMPAWEYRLDDAALWDLTAFVSTALPTMSPAEYRERVRRSLRARPEGGAPNALTSSLESSLGPSAETSAGSGAADGSASDATPSAATPSAGTPSTRTPSPGASSPGSASVGAPLAAFRGYAAMPPVLGDPRRGARAIPQYGCTTCHAIPGILGRPVRVGPPLHGIAGRDYLGGVLPNTPDNMVRWLLDPPAADPDTAMPNLGLTPADAADIAAYLYTLGKP